MVDLSQPFTPRMVRDERSWSTVRGPWFRPGLAGLPEPQVNPEVRDGGFRTRLDLVHPDLKLVIEYDGQQHRAADLDQWDRRRTPGQRWVTEPPPLARLRAMTIRWIWLVPSKICITFASRMNRSTGKSRV